MPTGIPHPARLSWRMLAWRMLAAACGALCLIGCKKQSYRERVDRTRRYLEYLQQRDSNLAPTAWRRGGLELRVPRQFQERVESASGQAKHAPDAKTPPLPAVIARLDGLQGVWTAQVGTDRGDQKETAWMAIASNRPSWEKGNVTLQEALRFEQRVVDAVFTAAGQTPPTRTQWKRAAFPPSGEFAQSRTFHPFSVRLERMRGAAGAYQALLYVHTRDSLQVAVLFLLPQSVSKSEKLSEAERIGLSLETLRFYGRTSFTGLSSR